MGVAVEGNPRRGRPSSSWSWAFVESLLLQSLEVGDQSCDIGICQVVIGLHHGLVILTDAFLDGLGGLLVRDAFPIFAEAHVLDIKLLAHFGVALALDSVAFGAFGFVGGLAIFSKCQAE